MKRVKLADLELNEINPYYESCPNCGYDFGIYKAYEIRDNQMLHSCEDCDWYDYNASFFWIGGWSISVSQGLAPVDILQSLLTNQEVVEFLKPRLKDSKSYLASPPKPFRQWDDDYLWGEVGFASKSYWGQMAVLTAAYVELIFKDFLRCYFIAQPDRMVKYLPPVGEEKAEISFRRILKYETKETLIEELSKEAVGNARPSRLDKVLKSLLNDSRIELDRPLVKNLASLRDQRNQFAHEIPNEGTGEMVDAIQVYNWFDDIQYLLYVLAGVAVRCGVPYWDDVGFLHGFEDNGL